MNVTKNEIKDRQLHIEDYLQMVSAEQKEYAEVSAHSRITENNDIITNFQTDTLLDAILQSDNLNKAYKKVKSNKGAGGVDGDLELAMIPESFRMECLKEELDSKEVQTETLTITATPLGDGMVKAKTGNTTNVAVYADWYKTVYVPTVTLPAEQTESEG